MKNNHQDSTRMWCLHWRQCRSYPTSPTNTGEGEGGKTGNIFCILF